MYINFEYSYKKKEMFNLRSGILYIYTGYSCTSSGKIPNYSC